ncbi:MAG: flagellar biosynthesis protein FlhF [Chitinispirillia bacterium]|nr:flagellar biosynthesis protein FlhF [Chitinispirillia bacterium]MCL2268628.1 flagellar biosynthesis protein FlhF [Chitinispirillia bacterium]
MRIKTYVTKSLREAYELIKNELGDDAVVISQETLNKVLGGKEYRVVAGVDENASPAKSPAFPPLKVSGPADSGIYGRPRQTVSSIVDPPKPEMPDPAFPEPVVRPYAPPRHDPFGGQQQERGDFAGQSQPRHTKTGAFPSTVKGLNEISEIKADVNELKDLVKTILENAVSAPAPAPSAPPPAAHALPEQPRFAMAGDSGWDAFVKRLVDSEVKPDIAKRLVNNVRGNSQLTDIELEHKLEAALGEQFPVSGPLKVKKGEPLIVAFVGPTGSGKTTTLAKLAAHCCFNKSRKISLITSDTYRIAAISQLQTFADIVRVGLQVVFSPDEIPDALAACGDSEVIFVDTAGRSQRNTEHMDELKQLVNVLRPDETHLVLSATTKDSDLIDMANKYRGVRVNRLLFTKLDETTKLGSIFNAVSELAIPVSYFTAGQSVPDDIELAQAGKFVKRLMEGRAM